jgi:hypothetical protein
MTDIAITDLTNSSDTSVGTGVFDVLMASIQKQIEYQYDSGRITGAEYATVYLGAVQSVLQQSMQFVLSEQEAGLKADLLEKQILEVAASTSRNNLESTAKISLMADQELEVVASTLRNDLESTAKISLMEDQEAEVVAGTTRADNDSVAKNALINDQELEVVASTTRNDLESTAKISLMSDQELEVVASTTRNDNDSAAKIDLMAKQELEVIAATTRNNNDSTQKVLLMAAQTLGFNSDTKQKLLKQMIDGYAVNQSVYSPGGDYPNATEGTGIDALANEILDDLSSSVNI